MNTAAAIDNEPQTIGTKLALALLAVQQEIGDVEKGAENPYFDSKYADLSSVIDTIKPVLNKHGIVFLQLPAVPKFEGTIALATILIHAESGQSVQAVAEVPLSKNDPQAYGSAMTYTRRYSLVSVIGLKAVDDDGNAASTPTIKKPQPQQAGQKKGGFTLKKSTAAVGVQKNSAKPRTGLFPKVATQTKDEEANAEK